MIPERNQISYRVKNRSPEYVAGFLSSATNILLTYPINKLIFRQHIYSLKTMAAYEQLKNEGFLILYRGMTLPMLQKTFSLSIMFGASAHYLELFQSMSSVDRWYYQPLSSALAGSTEAILTPLERIQMLLQTQKFNSVIQSPLHAFILIYRKYGLLEYYRGFTLILIRNSLSNVIFFACRKPIKDALPHSSTQFQNSLCDFLSGGLLGAFLSTLTYPINIIKNIQQSNLGINASSNSTWNMIRDVYQQRGGSIQQFYIGGRLNFFRSLLSWGIINTTYEYYLDILKAMIIDHKYIR